MEQVQASYNNIQTSQPYTTPYYGVPPGGQQVIAQPLTQFYMMNYMGQHMGVQGQGGQGQVQGQGQGQGQYIPTPPPNYQQVQANGYVQGAQLQPQQRAQLQQQQQQQQQLQQQQQYMSQLQQPIPQHVIQQNTPLQQALQQQQYQQQQNLQAYRQQEANGVTANGSAAQTGRDVNGIQSNGMELKCANTSIQDAENINNNNIRRSKYELVWGEYNEDSPKSVAQVGVGELALAKTSLNPNAQDFVPKAPSQVPNPRYRQHNAGYQNRMHNRDRNYHRGYNNNNYSNNNYNNYNRGYNNRGGRGGYMKSGVNNMRQFPNDPHQSARKLVKQCVNRVRDMLDKFRSNDPSVK
eukprot:TRINITY_DN26953_c0_g1_i2.p1 TRINITY_DN26953_c0_g1~~TRINITY_DN26953_c0_g1_i2.p1  ORF type:complete len:351 (+),score=43.50 TRINITY_DN26953_c0_g1_i2:130-1182(+)